MLRAGLRRFIIVTCSIAAAVAGVSTAFGLVLDSSLNRALSLGYYLAGSFGLLGGFLLNLRGPLRPADDARTFFSSPFLGTTGARTATGGEQRETVSASLLYAVIGLVLLAIGVAIDSRFRLV